jgi:hypothetical protein
MADPEILRYVAARTGLGLKYLSKDEKISLMLEQLRGAFPEAVFKGGTALNRAHLSKLGVSRFSEDIDLDFIRSAGLNDNVSRIKKGMFLVKGFDIREPKMLHRTLRFDCGYMNEFGDRDQIRVEFYVNDVSSYRVEDVLIKSPFLEAHSTLFRTYSLEDLMARKLIALHNRTEGKDIYDLFYALDLDFDTDSLAKALRLARGFYHIDEEGFWTRIDGKLAEAGANWRYIGQSTNHFIPASLRPEWRMFIDTLALKVRRKLTTVVTEDF